MNFEIKKEIFHLVTVNSSLFAVERIIEIIESYSLEMVNAREEEIRKMLIREDLNWLAEAITYTSKKN